MPMRTELQVPARSNETVWGDIRDVIYNPDFIVIGGFVGVGLLVSSCLMRALPIVNAVTAFSGNLP